MLPFYYQNLIINRKRNRIIKYYGRTSRNQQIPPTKDSNLCFILQQFAMHLINTVKLLASVSILLMLAGIGQCQNECSPAFTLPNILKDQVSLQYNNGNEQTYSYLFFSGMFSGQPVIGYSLSQMNIQQTNTTLNFYLDVDIQDMYIYFYFNSPNFKWTVASINFWITSRNDIIVAKNIMKNLNKGQNSTVSFPISSTTAFIDSQSTHVVFLVGLYCTFTKNLTLSINPGSLTSTTGAITVNVGSSVSVANITILSIIYNPSIGQYLSNSGILNYKKFTNQYYNLFNNFVPIYYALTGINTLTLTGTSLNNFQYDLEIVNSTILQASANNIFDVLGISYVTIGAVTNSICSPCNNYIYSGQCLDSCPTSTYPYTFTDSGKACLTCDARVGQIINSLGNGCSCLPGYQLISANQCANSNTQSSCTGVNVIQNGTTCICAPGTFNISGICGVCPAGQTYQSGACVADTACPANSNYNSASSKCVCNSGYMNISGFCIPCQQGQFYDNVNSECKCIAMNQEINPQGTCVCSSGFYNINGFCIACPDGTVYDGNSCVTQTTPTCSSNQVMVNGSCTCDSSSIAVGSLCIKCDSGTFANKGSNLCDSCISNCASCLNKVTCSQCNTGYIFDFSSLKCTNPNGDPTTAPAKLVSIKAGFPFYTRQGIITDFIINSTKITSKSKPDLMKMVSLQFGDMITIPHRIYYSQNSNQLDNIRIGFYYRGLIPLSNFSVLYIFNDETINLQQNMTVPYQYNSSKLQYKLN